MIDKRPKPGPFGHSGTSAYMQNIVLPAFRGVTVRFKRLPARPQQRRIIIDGLKIFLLLECCTSDAGTIFAPTHTKNARSQTIATNTKETTACESLTDRILRSLCKYAVIKKIGDPARCAEINIIEIQDNCREQLAKNATT